LTSELLDAATFDRAGELSRKSSCAISQSSVVEPIIQLALVIQ